MKKIKSAILLSAFGIAAIAAFAFKPSSSKFANNSYKKASCTIVSAYCLGGSTPCTVGTTALFSDVNTCVVPAFKLP
jgi:hypothetical protein